MSTISSSSPIPLNTPIPSSPTLSTKNSNPSATHVNDPTSIIKNLYMNLNHQLKLDWKQAVASGSAEKVKALLKENFLLAFIPLVNNDKFPIHEAIDKHHREVVKILLPLANLMQRDEFQMNAYDHSIAAGEEEISQQILKLIPIQSSILQTNAEVQALISQVKESIEKEAASADQESIKRIKIALDERDERQLIPLEKAIRLGAFMPFLTLIGWGANVKANTHDGKSLLELTLEKDLLLYLNILLRCGADANQKDKKGVSLVSKAIANDKMQFAYLLMAHGATLDPKDMKAIAELSKKRDPLTINSHEKWLFLTTIAYWLAQGVLTVDNGYSKYLPLAINVVGIGILTAQSLTEGKSLWKKGLATLGFSAMSVLPQFSIGLQAWNTVQAISSLYKGVMASSKCYVDRPWQSLCKSTVNAANALQSLNLLKQVIVINYIASQENICAPVNPSNYSVHGNDLLKIIQEEYPKLDPQCKFHASFLLEKTEIFKGVNFCDITTAQKGRFAMKYSTDKNPKLDPSIFTTLQAALATVTENC